MNSPALRPPRLAVVGAGWAGLAAAVSAARAGARVQLFEMARVEGGRARTVADGGCRFDNGQHILIGAYARCLSLMRTVGVDPQHVLLRRPLALIDPSGQGLRLGPGHPALAFARAVLAHRRWSLHDRLRLLQQAAGWGLKGFRCRPDQPVSVWAAGLPAAVRAELIDPLCVAALNTPASQASTATLLTVLRDGLFGGRGSADLLLPSRRLGELMPEAATRWLRAGGHRVEMSHRVGRLDRAGAAWVLDGAFGEPFDGVVLACSSREAARLAAPWAPDWAATAAAMAYEPICTAWVQAPAVPWPAPMVMLTGEPAQFAFDLGALGEPAGTFTVVCSGAGPWVEAGPAALRAALERQLDRHRDALWPSGYRIDRIVTEKRATFRCVPGLVRPAASIAAGLMAAGDYVAGPYPATLEGAARAGEAAAEQLIGPII